MQGAKMSLGTRIMVGKNQHWENFVDGAGGDFHGKFCRWDPKSCDLLIETHLLRSYHVHGQGSDRFVHQNNKIFFDDERGTVERGPWDMIRDISSTECGIIHPRVGSGESGTTFIVSSGAARATAWAVHNVVKPDFLLSPGVVPLGKGYAGQGFMIEMMMKHASDVKLSVGYVYDDIEGDLQHVTFNREDSSGWPSPFWGDDKSMLSISAQDVNGALGLKEFVSATGCGHQIEIPVKSGSDALLQELKIVDIKFDGHLSSLEQTNTAIFKLPDGLIVLVPRSIPFGHAWSAAYLFRPSDAEIVHSLETRYTASGAFDCFRHVEFVL
mmetsp:Transcript_97361/g.142495  ORF Transcript_97361/g.142495 Transcript_97361/m.142495 type:complete len:326 (-) Transcript_97361:69-1046(-)